MSRKSQLFCWLAIVWFVGPSIEAQHPVSYSYHVRPILSRNCFSCHGPDEEKREAGLAFHVRQMALAKGDSGNPAIVPGQPLASELLRRVTNPRSDMRMPPDDHGPPLTAAEIGILERWIVEGATYDLHWAYRPIQRPDLPQIAEPHWAKNGIDYFIAKALEERSLQPAKPASPEKLVRRLHLDLIGLPPDPDVISKFESDPSDVHYERLVDSLLSNPRFGEHWARMWLDLARYADSQGYAEDRIRQIWLYRDWVIDAFNRDLPFDQFTIEQLAGDLLPEPTESQLIATAFHRNTMTNSEGGTDDEEFRHAAIVDRVNTTGVVWLGTTIGCAQCHTHKFDPISQVDYFRMFAIFNQTEDSDKDNNYPFLEHLSEEQLQSKSRIQEEIAGLERAAASLNESQKKDLEARRELLAAELEKIKPVTVPIMRELAVQDRRQTHVAVGGAFSNKGQIVEPGIWPELASQQPTKIDRLTLAQWLVSRGNPLVSRVAVNRHWEKIFGRGIVETTEDFGSQGALPSHPELLDWLASEFFEARLSMKQLTKLMVMSATYRQDSLVTQEKLRVDPENRLLSRGARYRLTAEQLRDQALAVSGLLSTKMYGPPVRPPQPKLGISAAFGESLDWDPSPGEDRYRRGIYTLVRRTNLYPSFMAFDAPNRTICTSRRTNTNTPVAALVTLNDPVFVECARALALNTTGDSPDDKVQRLFRKVLGRYPVDLERLELKQLFETRLAEFSFHPEQAAALLFADPDDQAASLAKLQPRDRFPELAAWAIVGNVLLNLDEFLTRN